MNELERITRENMMLRTSVKNLQDRVDSLEQQGRANNVEICGVPEKESENVLSIVTRIAENIGCPIEPSEVDSFYRVPTFDPKKPKTIVVKFLSKHKRDSFLGASKAKRRQLGTSRGFKIDNISHELYINEHLTTRNKKLLMKTKDAARSKNYKFVWIRDGAILVRKDERSKIMRISDEDELAKIV
ncbi:uncharacterized protein LOC123313017 [Coccinella septempunctata]|uniref:uncharacterized protein LOC123313017 n=1 Tax=Coccinella septempunctata TaxID=41139 RepID=UPI001D08E583|nr:uncharacterized protein LOC123313017 [Coccinella septempunctata]